MANLRRIDDYFEGRLDEAARADFEAQLEKDEQLQQAVERYRTTQQIAEGLLELDIMDAVNAAKARRAGAPVQKKKTLPIPALALALVVPIVLIWVLAGMPGVSNNQWDQNEAIAEVLANYERPTNATGTLSTDTLGMTPFEKGTHFFFLNRFAESEQWFTQHIDETTSAVALSEAYYWLGAALVEQEKIKAAKAAWQHSQVPAAVESLVTLEEAGF